MKQLVNACTVLALACIVIASISVSPAAAQAQPTTPQVGHTARCVLTPAVDAPVKVLVVGARQQIKVDASSDCPKSGGVWNIRLGQDATKGSIVRFNNDTKTLDVDRVDLPAAPARDVELLSNTTVVATLRAAVVAAPSAAPGPLHIAYDVAAIDQTQSHTSRTRDDGGAIAVANPYASNRRELRIDPEIMARSRYGDSEAQHLTWWVSSASWGEDARFEGCNDGTGRPGKAPCQVHGIESLAFRALRWSSGDAPLRVTLELRAADKVLLSFPVELAARAARESVPLDLTNRVMVTCNGNETVTWCAQGEAACAWNGGVHAAPNDQVDNGLCRMTIVSGDLVKGHITGIPEATRIAAGPQRFVAHVQVLGADKAADTEIVLEDCEDAVARSVISGEPGVRDGKKPTKPPAHVSTKPALGDNGGAESKRTDLTMKLDSLSDEYVSLLNKQLAVAPPDGPAASGTKPAATENPPPPGPPPRCPDYPSFPLKMPAGDSTASYTVTLRPAPSTAEFVRRDLHQSADSSPVYEGTIKKRGPYAFRSAPWRVFVTIPIGLFGVRSPASPADLTRSSENRNVQFTNVSAGLLVGTEPWDYRFGRSSLPIPTRIVGGFHVVDPFNERRGVALLTGVMITMPTISTGADVPDLSSIGLGFFYENDLREAEPLSSGHRLLVTATVNILTVGNQKAEKK